MVLYSARLPRRSAAMTEVWSAGMRCGGAQALVLYSARLPRRGAAMTEVWAGMAGEGGR